MTKLTAPAQTNRPHFASLHHLSLACRSLEEAKRFYIEVLGAELFHDTPGFSEVLIADIIIGLSEQSGGWTGHDDEYPHYAFYADAANFVPMIDGLKDHGVVTPGPWTRDGKKGLMYFRDPSGNLFEIYCGTELPQAANFPRGAKQGGSYTTDYAGLFYEWDG